MSEKLVGNRRKRQPNQKRQVREQLNEELQDMDDFNAEMEHFSGDDDLYVGRSESIRNPRVR